MTNLLEDDRIIKSQNFNIYPLLCTTFLQIKRHCTEREGAVGYVFKYGYWCLNVPGSFVNGIMQTDEPCKGR